MLTAGAKKKVFGVLQLFERRGEHGKILLLVAKLSDDFLVAG